MQEQIHMERLLDRLKENLMEFLYQYPVYHRLIDSEDAGEFLDFCLPGIQGMLDSYRYAWVPFDKYLKIIVKRRRDTWLRSRKKTIQEERCILTYEPIRGITGIPAYKKGHEEGEEPEILDDVPDVFDIVAMQKESDIILRLDATSPTKLIRKKHRNRQSAFTLDARYRNPEKGIPPEVLFSEISWYPATFHITAARRACLADLHRLNPAAYRLCLYLTSPLHRRRILMLMMTSPDRLEPHDIEFMAALFDVDVALLEELLWHARKLQVKQQRNRESLEINRNTHWIRMVMLQEQENLYGMSETDEKMKASIVLEHQKEAAYKRRLHDLKHMQSRLSHSNIAHMLKIPHGTVCSGIHYGKALIQRCLYPDMDDV